MTVHELRCACRRSRSASAFSLPAMRRRTEPAPRCTTPTPGAGLARMAGQRRHRVLPGNLTGTARPDLRDHQREGVGVGISEKSMVISERSRSRTRKIGTFTPCANRCCVTPSGFKTSSVRACTTQARDVLAPAGCLSTISDMTRVASVLRLAQGPWAPHQRSESRRQSLEPELAC